MQFLSPQQSPKESNAQYALWGCIALVTLAVTLLVGILIGLSLDRLSASGTALSASSDERQAQRIIEPQMGVFWDALNLLYRDYYGDMPDAQEITYSAVRGIVDDLGDPHTSFLTPAEAEHFRTTLKGVFEGIGCRVDWLAEENAVVVLEPFENQPAWNAGIRRKDLIVAVDGEPVSGHDLTWAVQKMRGKSGTTVALTIQRSGEDTPRTVEVTRGRVESPTVVSEAMGEAGQIAYIRLYTFNENAGQLVRQAVEKALQNKAKGIIFDLRGNGGGLLREAVKVTNVFVEDATVVFERFKDGKTETYSTETKAIDPNTPLIILMDEATASASEIVAGALRDLGRARLLGVTTFGKGSVQLPHSLSDGSIVRVTVAKWFTPNDHNIDGKGLEPDIRVEISEDDRDAERDPQLESALQHLKSLK